ncbi:hypothetical protein AVEN_269137-1 [Araneus ventricosus]|uniref:Uncharacterized protein n=1 Tax=Araneus ventricosus TaxID=182803 RepID=A0A4Y2GZ56_ARAVE|nr:hypothetical protein AVEN_269137-1 [Araneus ventricosus]
MPVIKQRDTDENCAKTLASTENKLAEDTNTPFIEEKSVKDRSPPKQGSHIVRNLDEWCNIEVYPGTEKGYGVTTFFQTKRTTEKDSDKKVRLF